MSIPTITVVHTSACHSCVHALETLAGLGDEIQLDPISADSAAGKALVATHRPTMFPLVLVDGSFFSQGRLPRAKLRALLARQAVTPR
jgi:alkyl hydroperoxide reductase subunit AhpF